MKNYISMGSSPYDEKCAQVGRDDYESRSSAECRAYKSQLSRMFPDVRFGIKSFDHDAGFYKEVVAHYDSENEVETGRVFEVEECLPELWDEESVRVLSL